MKRSIGSCAILILGIIYLAAATNAPAQEDFYRGKTLRIIVGFAAGGGYDTFTRTVARHIDKYIPGQPAVVVENMPGAGSLVAANYLYNRAKPDGLTAGVFSSGLVTQQAMDSRGVRFDARRFRWIGSMSKGTPVCAIMAFTGLRTLEDVMSSKKELKIGSTGPGTTTHDLTNLMITLMDAPFKVISGYGGTSDVRLAMQRREIDGACWTWESMRTTARAMLDANGEDRLIPFVIQGRYDDPLVKELPQFTDAIKDKDKLAAFKAWLVPYEFFRPMAFPPNTPNERIDALRAALRKTMEDPAFLADAKKSKLDVEYTSGEAIEKAVEEVLDLPPKAEQLLASAIGR
ncbi:MAG TPA: tripartite tricarboxylate transporter substrate-binding protein [Candidatus Eisenbacteria bacterium]|nr:tripartite tricarboxylate transporter substrate-binding protein [Candidatus Eisenbacteria bacterium]